MQWQDVLIGIPIGTYFGLLIIFTYHLAPRVRLREYLKKNTFYENNLHSFIWIRQILFFLLPIMLSITILDGWLNLSFTLNQFSSLIVLGLSINVFWIVQLPLLTKAHLFIDFGVDQINDFNREITLKVDSEQVIYTRVYNLGFSTLKNVMFLIYFREGVEIIPYSNPNYMKLDFAKEFSIQKEHCGAAFKPTAKNFLTIPPQEWFVFPLIVKSSKTKLEIEIEVLFNSENSWGQTKHKTTMKIA